MSREALSYLLAGIVGRKGGLSLNMSSVCPAFDLIQPPWTGVWCV